jgi:hypothetical protein
MKRSSWLLRLRIARGDDPPRLSYRVAQKSASGHQTLGREHDEDHGLGFDSGDGLQQPRTERTFERVEAPDWLGQLPTRLATRPKAGRRRVNATGRSVGVLLSTPASLVAVTAVVVDLLPQKRPRLGAVRECVKPPDVVNLRHLRPVRGARNREKVGPCPIRPPPAPSSRGRPARRFSPARVTARRTLRPPRSQVEKSTGMIHTGTNPITGARTGPRYGTCFGTGCIRFKQQSVPPNRAVQVENGGRVRSIPRQWKLGRR